MMAIRKRRRIAGGLALMLILLTPLLSLPCAAEGTSFSYTYDYWKNSVEVPAPYTAEKPVTGDTLGQGSLSSPQDLYVTGTGEVYVLDSGNSRILKLDSALRFQETITLKGADGTPIAFQEAQGIFVEEGGRLYVADKKARTVYIAESDGTVIRQIGAPPADKVTDDFDYTPAKVVVNSAGIIYVISANTYSGALMYEQNGQFIGFYGAERVSVTPQLLLQRFWKSILSEEAASGIMRSVPTSFINFDLDESNFVYTIKGGTARGVGQVRKLNSLGENILFNEEGEQAAFGDLDTYYDNQTNSDITTTLNDISVDEDGFITVTDSTRARVFQYDQNSNLLYAFGGQANQYGTFQSPVAVDSVGDRLLVLDAGAGCLHVFTPTSFGANVRKAILLYNDGQYEEAMEPWEDILAEDANYELANVGMGKIYEQTGEYDKAMEYYRRGNYRTGYSDTFKEERADFIRGAFPVLLALIVLLVLGMVIYTRYQEKHRKSDYEVTFSKWRYPFQVSLHPFKSYYDLKVEKKGSVLMANLIVFAFFITSVIHTQLTGFHFNENRTDQFNVFVSLATTVGVFVVWVVCNWAVSTLADGEGTFREIWIFSAYAILPYVIGLILLTVLSNAFTLEEASFYSIAQVIVYAWTGVNLLMATREVHQYSMTKTIGIILGTLLGIFLVMLFVTIAYSMFTQLVSFIGMIYNEIRLK